MKNADRPCLNCGDRFPGCHGTCDRYAKLKSFLDGRRPKMEVIDEFKSERRREASAKKK